MSDALRAAIRSLTHRPALSLTVSLTLSLGIGANSAIFSAVDAVLLRPDRSLLGEMFDGDRKPSVG